MTGAGRGEVPRVEVAAAVMFNPQGEFLLAQRPAGKVYAGYWEFPGGKIEPGESVAGALARELHEELGIDARSVYPWLTRDFIYPHAAVRLRFCRVMAWSGTPHGKEGQQFAWQRAERPTVSPILPANGPVLRALQLPTTYAITNAAELGEETFLARLEHALARGLRLLQVREKSLAPPALHDFTVRVLRRAHAAGARVLINSDTRLARSLGADGVHLNSAQLMQCPERPQFEWCAASCHNASELARAADLGMDFVVLGPVQPTLSHPNMPALGWDGCAELIRNYPLPVYVLGGLVAADMALAQRHGAHGIGMLRGAWPKPA